MPRKAVAPKGYLTSEEARARLGISKPTIGRWAKAGKIRPYNYQGATVFQETEITKLAAEWGKGDAAMMLPMEVFTDGVVICGDVDHEETWAAIRSVGVQFPLVIADPPYGNILRAAWDHVTITDDLFVEWMLEWTRKIADVSLERSAFYCWGGTGRVGFRPFYKYLASVESKTKYQLANHVTWRKRRAYGTATNYLYVREEIAYLTLGDIKKPRCFHVPLLEEKRPYAGFNKDYPAKSEHYRRGNVWDDFNELFSGKVHDAQKPLRAMEIPIEVHTEPGEWCLDPFAGSGTTALAARKLGRRFVVVDKDPECFARICALLGAA